MNRLPARLLGLLVGAVATLLPAVAGAAEGRIGGATAAPPRRPPHDALYHRVRSYLEKIMGPPVFAAGQQPNR